MEDMAVLVRKRDQAATIASAYKKMISHLFLESLSLESSMHVNFLISLIRLVCIQKIMKKERR